MKIISSRKKCGFFSSEYKKNIPNTTSPTFQEVGGVTQPLIFCRWHKNISSNRVNHHIMDRFLLSRYFYVLFATVFIEMNQNVDS